MLFIVHCAIDEPMLLIVSRDFNMIYFDFNCKYLASFIIYGLLAQNHADSRKIVAKLSYKSYATKLFSYKPKRLQYTL